VNSYGATPPLAVPLTVTVWLRLIVGSDAFAVTVVGTRAPIVSARR
jgi:hypothetical protein